MQELFSESLFEQIETIARLGVYQTDLVRQRWTGSRNFVRLFGLEEKPEYTIEEFQSLVHPEDFDPVMDYFQHCLAQKDEFNMDYRCIVDGRTMHVESRTRIYRNNEGTPVGLIGIKRDISHLQQAEHHLKAAFEAAPNGMILVNRKREIVLLNRQIEEIFGYARDELLGSKLDILVPEEFKEGHSDDVARYFENPAARNMGRGRDLFGIARDGSRIPLEIGLRPVDRDGATFVICSIVDITDRNAIMDRLRSKNKELQDFAYRIAHDIRSPLGNVQGLLELSKMQLDDPPKHLQTLELMESVARQLLLYTDDIISSALNSDDRTEPTKPLDLDQLKERLNNRYGHTLEKESIDLHWDCQHHRVPRLSANLIEEILDNLVSNAIKYHSENRDSWVRITTFSDNESFYVQVSDNGIGIPTSQQSHVFEMFSRFHPTTNSGSGLGLYLVKKSVQKGNGTIHFDSDESGTRFYLKFPMVAAG